MASRRPLVNVSGTVKELPAGDTVAETVAGPSSVTDDLPAIFDGTTGKLIKSKTYAAFKTLLALVKGDVGLGNVDNTSDAAKPVSTATQTALDAKVAKAGDTMTGALVVDADVFSVISAKRTNDGTLGAAFATMHESASPAASDVIGTFQFQGRDSDATQRAYGDIRCQIVSPTSGAGLEGRYEFRARLGMSTPIHRLYIAQGLYHASATGGDKGNNTINFGAVYDDNVLLTPYVLEQARDGTVDLVALDDKVPDLLDEDGTVVEVRLHEPARKFLARIGTEYDPFDLDAYAKHWRDKAHLSSMVNPAKAKDGKVISMGAWIQRLIETVEIQAVHIDKLNQRVKALEGPQELQRMQTVTVGS